MKNLLLIGTFLVASLAMGQDQYTKGMQKAFQLWGEGKNSDASNLFERISTAESDNWLPYYYVSTINTLISFGEKDFEKLTLQLEKAQEFIDLAKAISPDNPEIMVQQALIHTAWIAYDGAKYGMTLSGKVTALYEKAEQLAPENPRVMLSKAEWNIGSAKFFGQDTSLFCKDVERSLELFANFKAESDFHPQEGKERAEEILESCNQ